MMDERTVNNKQLNDKPCRIKKLKQITLLYFEICNKFKVSEKRNAYLNYVK